jgi:cyclic pyranopterin phosphate synthase
MAQVLTQITQLPGRSAAAPAPVNDPVNDPAHAHGEGPLVDGFGRTLRALRVSVTDACQFRCLYCMPSEDMTFLPHGELLTPDEIERVVGLLVRLGITNVRLTGGEPLVRRELPDIVRRLAALQPDGLSDLSLTTNGFLLERHVAALADAGLQRLNVSVDSLVAETFRDITRRDALNQVLAGLRAAEAYPQMRPIKVNAVALRDTTDREVRAFADLARTRGYVIRFIEFMPLDGGGRWSPDSVLTGAELKAALEASVPSDWLPLEPMPMADPAQTSRVYRFADGVGEIGFINPVSEPFCDACDRLRLTAEGTLRTCLFSIGETDLRGPMRAGASDAQLEEIVREAAWNKELKHHIGDPGFRPPPRNMSQIGG